MKIKTKRLIFIFLLSAGIVWNIVCAAKLIPIHFYGLSGISVAACMAFYILMPNKVKGEKSKFIKDLSIKEKAQSMVTLFLILGWFLTIIICASLP